MIAKYSPDDAVNDKPFSLNRLRKIDWKLSVGVASHCCNKLSSGYVTLTFILESGDLKKVEKHTFELSIPEFYDLVKNFTDMSSLME